MTVDELTARLSEESSSFEAKLQSSRKSLNDLQSELVGSQQRASTAEAEAAQLRTLMQLSGEASRRSIKELQAEIGKLQVRRRHTRRSLRPRKAQLALRGALWMLAGLPGCCPGS